METPPIPTSPAQTRNAARPPPGPLVRDAFTDDRPRGKVIGTAASATTVRQGVDAEHVLSIDHGALRIEPLARPGWGRSGIAYGPFARTPGLAMAVLIDNGHNMSQSCQLKSWVRQSVRWMRGSGTEAFLVRVVRWLGHRPRMVLARKLNRWFHSRTRAGAPPPTPQHESLAVGFFPSPSPADPIASGNGLVIHASRAHDNGELWARIADRCGSTCTSLQNLTMYYIVVLRDRGAVYYAAALPGAHGVGGYPGMRPIAIDPFNEQRELYAGVHQAVLGEIGFTMDTRVHGVTVAELGREFGTAHIADHLHGERFNGVPTPLGGAWKGSGFERTPLGARAQAAEAIAITDPGAPTGLLHAIIEPTAASGPVGLVFRARDQRNLWAFIADAAGCRVRVCEDGTWLTIADGPSRLAPGRPNSVQIVDHGSEFTVLVNGEMALDRRFEDSRLASATGVGLYSGAPGDMALIRDVEAHPRLVPIPTELDMGPPWSGNGARVLIRDEFAGPKGDLDGHTTSLGARPWRHDLGTGRFEITGDGAARVNASIGIPCPGRSIYTVAWDDPELADIDLEMTPPGTRRHENHRGRSGVVFWQDKRNYLMVNLWLHDNLETASISTFFCINGFDDLYDAIWTCTGPNRTTWGVPFRFRSIFDGNRFLIRINGEPVLYRSLTDVYPRQPRLRITRIGLLANWEWGTDTGTIFRDFVARGR